MSSANDTEINQDVSINQICTEHQHNTDSSTDPHHSSNKVNPLLDQVEANMYGNIEHKEIPKLTPQLINSSSELKFSVDQPASDFANLRSSPQRGREASAVVEHSAEYSLNFFVQK